MDGLESLFSPSMMATANAILRAFNNRKYIFFVTLMLDQAKLKAVEEKKKEDQGGSRSPHTWPVSQRFTERFIIRFILLHDKLLQFDWLRAVVLQLNLKYLHVKITNLLRVVV